MAYDYYEAVKNDIRAYIEDNHVNVDADDFDEGALYDEMVLPVTGNDDGSYFCNSYKAEEALLHNTDLLNEALDEFGDDSFYRKAVESPEAADIFVRDYVFGQCFEDVLNEFSTTGDFVTENWG